MWKFQQNEHTPEVMFQWILRFAEFTESLSLFWEIYYIVLKEVKAQLAKF